MAESVPEARTRWTLDRHPIAVGVVLVLFVLLCRLLGAVADVFVFGFLAILFGTLLTYPIDLLARIMPRGLAVVVTLLALLGGVGAATLAVVPLVVIQGREFLTQIPDAAERARSWLWRVEHSPILSGTPGGSEIATSVREKVTSEVVRTLPHPFPFALSVGSAVSGLVLLLALAFFLAHEPDSYVRGVRRLVPKDWERDYDEAVRRVGAALKKWVGGILVSMTIMGTLTAIGLAAAGIPGWFTLALITFAGTFVPYAGAVASAVPGLVVGLAKSPAHFGWALLVYVGVHVVEGYIVQPLIMKRAVEIRPATLLLWGLGLGAVLGLGGIVVATPLLACVQVGVRYLWTERALGKPAEEPPDLAVTALRRADRPRFARRFWPRRRPPSTPGPQPPAAR